MKIKQYLFAMGIIALAIGFNSCKKADRKDEMETTFELSGDQAIADNLTEDANDVFMEIAVDNSLTGSLAPQPVITTNIIACATVTITPASGKAKINYYSFRKT